MALDLDVKVPDLAKMYQTSTATMMAARTQPTMIGVVSSSLPSSLDGVSVVSRPSVVVSESNENVH